MRFTLVSVLIAAAVFAAVAPTLPWLEFSSGSENLVTETVLEMRRGGPWIIPELAGAPRISKPPLPAWISATFVRPASVTALSNRETRDARDAAYRMLAWEIRWPALVFASLTIVAGAWLGRLLLQSDRGGWATAVMIGSSILLLRFGRTMSTDVQLALWGTVANVFLVMAVLNERRRWLSCALAGAALGLALMSKGPVTLAQTILPLLVFAAWRRWKGRPTSIAWAGVALAGAIALAIALPWPIWAATRLSGLTRFWFNEVAAGGQQEYAYTPPWVYLSFIPLVLPWTGFFILGFVALLREKSDRGMLAIAFTIVPIVIMACFPEKNDRYLLPMIAPAAVICAAGFLSRDPELDPMRRIVNLFTWGFLLVLAVGFPLAGVLWMRDMAGKPWYGLPLGTGTAVGVGLLVAAGWRFDSSGRRMLLPIGAAVILLTHALFIHGYANTDRGRSDGRPVAEFVIQSLPPDVPVWVFAEQGRFSHAPIDTVIYLNRIVWPTSDLAALPTTRPIAVLVHCKPNQAMPPELLTWRVIGTSPKNKGLWRVCVPPGL